MTEQVTQEQIQEQLERPKISKLFKTAQKLGVIHLGFTAIDYLRYAIENMGWELTSITGKKGDAKSNFLLQRGYAIYGDWQKVHDHIITNRMDFIRILRATKEDERIPWIGGDDWGAIFPANLYQVDRQFYCKLKENWELFRTKINCVDFTSTRKNKVAKFIVEDITGHILCYARGGEVKSHYKYTRWMWLDNPKDPTSEIPFRITVEEYPFPILPESLNLDTCFKDHEYIVAGDRYSGQEFFKDKLGLGGVPRDEFKNYWMRRLKLASNAQNDFISLLEQMEEKNNPSPKEFNNEEQKTASEAARALVRMRKNRPVLKR